MADPCRLKIQYKAKICLADNTDNTCSLWHCQTLRAAANFSALIRSFSRVVIGSWFTCSQTSIQTQKEGITLSRMPLSPMKVINASKELSLPASCDPKLREEVTTSGSVGQNKDLATLAIIDVFT